MSIDPAILTHLPPLLEVAHVAHRLNVSQERVRRLIRRRQLRAVHEGRRWKVEQAHLADFVQTRVIDATGPPLTDRERAYLQTRLLGAAG